MRLDCEENFYIFYSAGGGEDSRAKGVGDADNNGCVRVYLSLAVLWIILLISSGK